MSDETQAIAALQAAGVELARYIRSNTAQAGTGSRLSMGNGERRRQRRRDWWAILRFCGLLFGGGIIIRIINGLWQIAIAASWGTAGMIGEIRKARRANRG